MDIEKEIKNEDKRKAKVEALSKYTDADMVNLHIFCYYINLNMNLQKNKIESKMFQS